MVSYLLRMPAGIPGDVNRAEHALVEAQVITPYGSASAPAAYGIGIVIDATSGEVRAPAAGDTGIYGFLVRPYPTQEPTQAPVLGTSIPPTQGACSILKRGYMTVKLQNTTAAVKDGPVFVRCNGVTGSLFAGGVEAAADATPANTIPLTNAYFMGPADSLGNVEIAVGINRNI
jgi:hypothetical protein